MVQTMQLLALKFKRPVRRECQALLVSKTNLVVNGLRGDIAKKSDALNRQFTHEQLKEQFVDMRLGGLASLGSFTETLAAYQAF